MSLDEKWFFNFLNLKDKAAGAPLTKIPLEQTIKRACVALSRDEDLIEHSGSGVPINVQRNHKGSKYFPIVSSIDAEARVYQNRKRPDHFTVLRIGIVGSKASRSEDFDEGDSRPHSEIITLTGRVKELETSDPSVWFSDPFRKHYLKGMRDCMIMVDHFLKKSGTNSIQDLMGAVLEKLREQMINEEVKFPW